ncbi:N-acetyltransferase [Shewanella algicola]|uniref:GNAT family N-acetyltransferase n=1 Tax=Shewanella algicola TaxID=640633 RepID=A0A9X1ZFK6_9GAMM|nr:GNAT family N-acetyltransferase [Shewanella algicola]MCL1107810.1 GNAT family N-acetyltransferase [Shewanella algicola]GGP39318.1 N-acetyltransferase [Shewanella algicola]
MQNSYLTPYHIVDFSPVYAQQVSELYHMAIQHIRHPRYPQAKLDAWSSSPRSSKFWQLKYQRNRAWLAVDSTQQVIGFISVETHFKQQGYIDCLYVAPAWQHQGIARALYLQLQAWVQQQRYPVLSVDASYLSKGLFEQHGFVLKQVSYQHKLGQTFNGFYMQKTLINNLVTGH